MKKLLLTTFITLTTLTAAIAQSAFTGSWAGKLEVGVSLRLVFHVKAAGDGTYTGTMDSPDQSAFGIPCDKVTVTGNTITATLGNGAINYTGTLENDTTIKGTFTQGQSVPLTLVKQTSPGAVKKLNRPQTPQPPFTYTSEDVSYTNKDKSISYGATITIPAGKAPFPAALIISGSGAQTRDFDFAEHKFYAVLADALTNAGYIVLRVDDRGTGKTTGSFANATTKDFADDATAGIDYLLSRPEVNKKKLGLIGHSEGGIVAPMIAANRKDIDFVILLAAPGVPIPDLMVQQNRAILSQQGMNEQNLEAYLQLYKALLLDGVNNEKLEDALTAGKKSMQQWLTKTDPAIVSSMGYNQAEAQEKIVSSLVQSFATPWSKYFFGYNPAPNLEKLSSKVLALNGNADIQVDAAANLAAIQKALAKSKAKNVMVKTIPGLNHLFQTCKTCTLNEYGELEETFSPVALKEIIDWLNKSVK